MIHRSTWRAAIALLGFVIPLQSFAAVRFASPFADDMVLQRDRKVIVWGDADPNAKVDVTLDGRHLAAQSNAAGHWRVELPATPAGGPHTLAAASNNQSASLSNVLFGDVWLCSGQSNMQMSLKECDDGPAIAARAGNDPRLRLCTVDRGFNGKPQTEAKIHWRKATPASARDFSAVAYYFATELLADPAMANVPVGVIDSSFGGTTCEGWIPHEALAPFKPTDLGDSMFGIKPSMLYNAMIAPLGPSALRGVIWYQGESNAGRPATYPKLLDTMIQEWRKQFDDQNLPFIIVQLPDWAQRSPGLPWTWIREAQAKAVKDTSNASFALAINTNDGFNLHPPQKHELGRRIALLARHDVYKEPNVAARGPIFKQARVEGASIRVTFDSTGGLVNNAAPGPLHGFSLAGEDGNYRAADSATIDGNSVIVHCDEIKSPKTVRYAWAGVPRSTLTDQSGLPAAPFRTDDLPPTDIEVQRAPIAHTVATPAYEITIDGDGRITSLGVRGEQFLSNALGMSGGVNIPGFFGPRALPHIRELAPDLLACSDGQATLSLRFRDEAMDWTLTNATKDDFVLQIHLAPDVEAPAADRPREPLTLRRGKAVLTIEGIDSITKSPTGPVLQTKVKGNSSTGIRLITPKS